LANAVTPETLLRWIGGQAGCKYDSSAKRGRGRPPMSKEIRDLAIQLATENPTWGYTKIQGVLKSLGHKVGRTTIRELLMSSGIVPAPDRKKGKKRKDFLRENLSVLSAVDFFTVEILTLTGFQRYSVMIVMQLATRRVTLAGIYLEPTGAWVEQI
jgi:putative transposase